MPKLSPKHTNVPGVLSKSFLGAKAKQKTPSLWVTCSILFVLYRQFLILLAENLRLLIKSQVKIFKVIVECLMFILKLLS